MQKLYFLIVFGIASAFFWEGSQINFLSNDLAAARHRAGKEGKMIVVQFGARWCMPCNAMYEGAWQNADVVEFTNANFVAVKMDIDQFDAMKIRDKYGIEAIPATLVLSSKGDEIKRFEGSMGSESLLGFLQTYAAPEHRSKINAAPLREIETSFEKPAEAVAEAEISYEKAETDPPAPIAEAEKAATDEAEKAFSDESPTSEPAQKGILNQAPPRSRSEAKIADRTAARPKSKTEKSFSPSEPSAPKVAPRATPKTDAPLAYSAPKKADSPANSAGKAAPSAAEKGQKSLQKLVPKSGFTTQAGLFATPGQAERLAVELSRRFGKRAFLAEGQHGGRRIMRALIGDFSTREEAAAFKIRLKNSGYDAFVKSWKEVQ